MLAYLEIARVGVAFAFLAIASLSDWRRREVDDWVWVAMALSSIALLAAEQAISFSVLKLILYAASIITTSALALLVYWLGLYGGADAKALICLSLAVPVKPSLANPILPVSPVFPISILDNTLVVTLAFAFLLFLRNLAKAPSQRLFEGLEEEALWKKLSLMFLGARVELRRLMEMRFVYPLEQVEVLEGGVFRKRIVLSAPLKGDLDPDKHIKEVVDKLNTTGVGSDYKIWVSPALPLLVFMLGGFGLALLAGDLLLSAVLLLTKVV